ncbi:unnamed protein product [Scytosiphon promiscuus]
MATRIALESKGQMSQGRKGSIRGGVRPPANQKKGGEGGFGWVTLSLVASIFFFLGHWLDLASTSGGVSKGLGATLPAAVTKQTSAPPSESVMSRTAAAAKTAAAAAAAAQAGISGAGEGGEGRSEL